MTRTRILYIYIDIYMDATSMQTDVNAIFALNSKMVCTHGKTFFEPATQWTQDSDNHILSLCLPGMIRKLVSNCITLYFNHALLLQLQTSIKIEILDFLIPYKHRSRLPLTGIEFFLYFFIITLFSPGNHLRDDKTTALHILNSLMVSL